MPAHSVAADDVHSGYLLKRQVATKPVTPCLSMCATLLGIDVFWSNSDFTFETSCRLLTIFPIRTYQYHNSTIINGFTTDVFVPQFFSIMSWSIHKMSF